MTLTDLRKNDHAQTALGLLFGIIFGFLLQKGGVTYYDVIMGQLLLTDFTVVKVMGSAVATGMIGFHLLKHFGLVRRHVWTGSIGSNVIGGLIFGLGFGLLGYCPGTVAGAVGQGSLDALFGGVIGLLIGAGIFARIYPTLNRSLLNNGKFRHQILPDILKVNEWYIVIPMTALIAIVLMMIESIGL
jgi:xanthosine utilization system XapX-like protein